MTSNMQQYRRDQLYLPTASPKAAQQRAPTGDYQSYKKESAFRRLVSGALRGPGEKDKRRPSASEYDGQSIAPPPEPAPRPILEDDRERRCRSHRKSNYTEAPRQVPKDDYPPVDKKSHRKSMYGELPRQAPRDGYNYPPVDVKPHRRSTYGAMPRPPPLDDYPPVPTSDKKAHRKSMYRELPRPAPEDGYFPTPVDKKSNRKSMYRELPRQAPEHDYPPVPVDKRSNRKSVYGAIPRQGPEDDHDSHPPRDERRYSRRGELKPLGSNPVVTPVEPDNYRPVNPKTENRATVDARRPYTTARLSRASKRHSRRAE